MKQHYLISIVLFILICSLLSLALTQEDYDEGDDVEIEEPLSQGFDNPNQQNADSAKKIFTQSFCDNPQRCQNIDEVWFKRIGIYINPLFAQQIWDPKTNSWKTFQEVYAPPIPQSFPPSTTTPSSFSNHIKFPGSGKCFELALSANKEEAQTKIVSVQFQGHTIQVNKLIKPLIEKINSEITAANIPKSTFTFTSVQTGKWRCVRSPKVTIVDPTTCLTTKGKIARSKHSYQVAIDINPSENEFCTLGPNNQYYHNGKVCQPTIPQKVIDIFKTNDFRWGGDWSGAKDYMHFEWKGHLGDFDNDPATIEQCGTSASTTVSTTPPPPPSGNIKFSFAVISDTPDGDCSDPGSSATNPITQGEPTSKAMKFINTKNPAFVISAGDLTSGECSANNKKVGQSLAIDQLNEFKNVFLKDLQVPFVPLAGNHDFFKSTSPNVWYTFWDEQTSSLLSAYNSRQKCGSSTVSGNNLVSRFEYNGKGFVLINPGYIGHTYGLPQQELDCINKLAQPGDFVFRHVSPFGVSCEVKNPSTCGRSVINPSGDVKEVEKLPQLLKQKNIAALYSGHTHAFYKGTCDNLPFINTGTLGTRAEEFVRGWSSADARSAFVWVDVYETGTKNTIYIYNKATQKFEINTKPFPTEIITTKFSNPDRKVDEGILATCKSNLP
ncbi:hypothetical protein A2642_01380 [Candidatus Nomurabacteria bacterium RIFCSPHIGHO2_01_FULL_39_10]|uniref:Calcineurin-like phosphoesterase domain-containing protein n=1 Tax=Candidatus Nomurabacteria bacterium RIFCSPHIGHO2_01_FULL_39_10 TaxID=1801733 RepID=A0A1F6V9M6_9BACT|nr:MAG: hypothetical protein A2642_01380 [Candidatus Nomurabacteria bacterium RIFCSPHIGHO2_01_FULL_39_10]